MGQPVLAQSTAAAASSPPPALPHFRALYDHEFDYVARTLRRLGVAGADLNDLCQEVFLAAFHRWHAYDPARPLRPWLFGIAFRAVSDHRYKAHHHREVRSVDPSSFAVPAVGDEAIEAREARSLVLAALEKLPAERRAVFIMHDLDGCAAPEISDSLGIPLNTVYSRLRVAREEMASAIKRLRPEGVPR
jgi:RNA polymerase sigma-70 factor (ECF subfamily)